MRALLCALCLGALVLSSSARQQPSTDKEQQAVTSLVRKAAVRSSSYKNTQVGQMLVLACV
jgi:hypothetical protein